MSFRSGWTDLVSPFSDAFYINSRDETMQLNVFGFLHNAHNAAAELLDNAVVRYGLPKQWCGTLRRPPGQVNEGKACFVVVFYCGNPTFRTNCERRVSERNGSSRESIFKPSKFRSRS